jgi:hypothetical protein
MISLKLFDFILTNISAFMSTIFDEVDVNPVVKLKEMYSMLSDLTNRTLHSPNVVKLMQSDEKFDLLFLEIFLDDALLGFAQHYNVPVVAMSTVGATKWVNDLTGSPNPISYIPNTFLSFTDRMTFFQRMVNFFFTLFEEISMRLFFYDEQVSFKQLIIVLVNDYEYVYFRVKSTMNTFQIQSHHCKSYARKAYH